MTLTMQYVSEKSLLDAQAVAQNPANYRGKRTQTKIT